MMTRVLLVWGNWGPYHYARFESFRRAGKTRGVDVEGLELYARSGIYAWTNERASEGMHHLDFDGHEMSFRPWLLLRRAIPLIFRLRPEVALLPSYWHWSLVLNLACRIVGCRVVMMNESHGGTERARGIGKLIKRVIVSTFDAALIGGSPHKRFFASLGLPAEKIFLGYDAIDNAHFSAQADAARTQEAGHRERLALPPRYFLSLGRFVEKKNLGLLVRAFATLQPAPGGRHHHLVFVGSGDEEAALRALCATFALSVVDHPAGRERDQATPVDKPAVHFYGFRQIEENPVFYALADAFILPSLYEEWGLVVNEAMACGIPVLASKTVGSAEDLVMDGDTGFTFDPLDVDGLARALQALVNDPDLVFQMGRASRARIGDWGVERFADGGLRAVEAALRH